MLPHFIEIETSRQCNRRCSWCPTGTLKDRSIQELMPWDVFKRMLIELAEVNYSGWLALHNFNEPLLNYRLDDEIRAVRAYTHRARAIIFTNGDFFDFDRGIGLQEAGAHSVRVTLYPAHLETPDPERIWKYVENRGLKNAGSWTIEECRQGISGRSAILGMELEIIVPDVGRYGQRGGTATGCADLRATPCFMTSHSMAIDYRGRIKMCCNVVPDAPGHARYVLGNATTSPLLRIWQGEEMAHVRRLHTISDWSETPICETCNQNLPPAEVAKIKLFDLPKKSASESGRLSREM